MSFARASWSWMVLSLGLVAPLGCSDSTAETQPAGPAFPTESAFCTALAQAVCNASVVTACYGSTSASLGSDTQSCVQAYSQPAECNPKALPYHPTGGEVCVATFAAAYADARLEAPELAQVEETCRLALNSGGPEHSSCNDSSDCEASRGFKCVVKPGAALGQCEIPVSVANGGDCGPAASTCAADYYCAEVDPTTHGCLARPDIGGQCAADRPCKADALCSATNNTCIAKLANGATCTTDGECLNGFCSPASKCAGAIVLGPSEPSCLSFLP